MNKIAKKITSIALTLLLAFSVLPSSFVFAQNLDLPTKAVTAAATTKKQVIGYITQWDAWKDAKAGLPAQGALNHLNIDYSKYTILNYSFFGVANDGSLHSGDYRNKNIYQPGAQQQPAPLFYTDIYSSWDLYLLYGELDPVNYISADIATKAKAQGFDVKAESTTWSHPGWNVYNQPLPLPLKKEGGAPGLLELAKKNGVKVNASVGGWSMCKHFPEMAADPVKRARFLEDCKRLIALGFDGIDLDWEYVGPYDGMNFKGSNADYANFITLVKEIRAAIGPDKLITSCFSASTNKLKDYNWPEVDKYVDYYNFMTYDFNGGWSNIAGHNSPLNSYTNAEEPTFSIDYLYQYLKTTNINMNKVNMGVPFYGRGVITNGAAALNAPTVKRSETIQPDGPITTCADYTNWEKDVYDGAPNYSFIKQKVLAPNSGWTVKWDDEAKVPYAVKGNSFLSYDDETSIGYKAQYIKDKNLAGAIVWNVYGDLEFGGSVTNYGTKLKKWSNVKAPLATKLNEVLNGSTQTAASPTFSPAGGTYTSAQNVTLSCATTGATIRYTTDGTEPTATSAAYAGAINVAKTTTIKAKAIATGYFDSPTVSATYTITSNPVETVATPTISPNGGTFTTAQNVTLACATAGATIRYTIDGTEPTASSTAYTNAINVAKTTTVKAKAFKSGMTDSATASATFTIGTNPVETVATPTISPNGGTFTTAQNVTLACATAGATIRYTIDGTEPTASSTAYTNAINVAKTTTVKAKAFKSGMTDSATAFATFTIGTNPVETVATPTISPNGGSFTTAQNVTIDCATAGATIRYTTDGKEPTASSTAYSSAINVSTTTTVKAKAFKSGMTDSATAFATFTISGSGGTDTGTPNGAPATPSLTHNNWSNNASYDITFNIWWGNNATSYTLYENNVAIESGSLNANSPNGQSYTWKFTNKAKGNYVYKVELANKFGKTTSNTTTSNVVNGSVTPIETVATPTFTPAAGSYASAQNVTIDCATSGATIRYTTNGAEPTASSTAYTTAINVSATTTVKAKAFKSGMNDSATASATYTIGTNPIETVATPTFNPAAGTYSSAQNVTIACATTGATIRYTTDGTEPAETSTAYSKAITVSATTTVKAKAFKSGMNASATASATYIIQGGTVVKEWAPYTPYKTGDIVSYNGKNYECRQPHTSLPGWEPPNVPALWKEYTGSITPVETVATPTFNPAAGTYTSAQNVTIACTTASATIRYTTDGTEPTATSTVYSKAINVSATTTVKAKAFKSGMNDSATATAAYTINLVNTVAAPTFNPQAGTYTGSLSISIATATAGATIYYTTNGTNPTTSSSVYSGPITISSTTTFKAKAIKAGMTDSAIITSVYTINTNPTPSLPAHILTGYWQNFDNGAKCLKISDVPTTYDLICVSFADATTTPGAITFNLDPTLSSKLGGYTKQQFIQDIAAAKTKGQRVILSIGGEKGTISVANESAATNFANSAYALMQEYGFDGVDIDLENGVNSTYMASALRQLSAKAGSSLIITMAPQTIDMQSTGMEYFKLALAIKDILTVVNMQYYNSGSMLGQDGNVYSQGSIDFLTALAAIQLENGLRPDQVGLGLPASPSGAGSGYINPTMVNTALNCLATGAKGGNYVPPRTYPGIRGAMTWSINWDASNNYNFANTVRSTLNSLPR